MNTTKLENSKYAAYEDLRNLFLNYYACLAGKRPKALLENNYPNEHNRSFVLDTSGNSASETNCADVLNNLFCVAFNHELIDNLPDVPYLSLTPMQGIVYDPDGIAKVVDLLSNLT